MSDAPPDKTVQMNAVEQTAAIRQLQRDVESLEQAVLMIVAALAALSGLSNVIKDEAETAEEQDPTENGE